MPFVKRQEHRFPERAHLPPIGKRRNDTTFRWRAQGDGTTGASVGAVEEKGMAGAEREGVGGRAVEGAAPERGEVHAVEGPGEPA